mgnify:CR=1 FL=1
MGHSNIFVGTMESYPGIDDVIRRLDGHLNARRVYIAPLMLAADPPILEAMEGAQPESWRSRLLAHDYRPIPLRKGLGECPGVRRIFVQHAQEALRSR